MAPSLEMIPSKPTNTCLPIIGYLTGSGLPYFKVSTPHFTLCCFLLVLFLELEKSERARERAKPKRKRKAVSSLFIHSTPSFDFSFDLDLSRIRRNRIGFVYNHQSPIANYWDFSRSKPFSFLRVSSSFQIAICLDHVRFLNFLFRSCYLDFILSRFPPLRSCFWGFRNRFISWSV